MCDALFQDMPLDAITVFRKRLEDAMSENDRFAEKESPLDVAATLANLMTERLYAIVLSEEQKREERFSGPELEYLQSLHRQAGTEIVPLHSSEREIKTRAFSDAVRQGRVPEGRLAPVCADRWE